ncbi:zinc-binding alcohol dehydrogenase family protein [Alphaproteobacteria bacterium]|nr:zinc-binding alcohol dehydrogenase family protein [Alphaproteobacteria bacterium]
MKSIIVEKPGDYTVLKIKNIETPKPTKSQVLIKVAYCSLNPLDTHSRAARVSWGAPKMPYTPGYEFAGRIVSIGENLSNELIGKRVSVVGSWGGNAEYAISDIKNIINVPNEFDWKLASCFATCAPTAWHLVNSAGKVKPNHNIVIHSAAGAVGILTAQIAKEKGAKIYGLVGSKSRETYAKRFPYDNIINRNECNWDEKIKDLTKEKGADIIFDGVAGSEAPSNYKAIAPLGNVIYIGQMGGPPPQLNISEIIGKSFSVTGFVQFFHQIQSNYQENKEIFSKLSKKVWKIPIEKISELEDIPDLHRDFEDRKLLGKTLIKVGGDV